MVYIPARETGAPRSEYLPVFDETYMIYIAANLSGNSQNPILRRAPLALHALENMKRLYNIDPERIYAAGLSGGGKMAVYMGLNYGDHFNGAMFIIGSLNVSDRARIAPTGHIKHLVQTRNRYVFLTGRQDFNRDEIRRHYAAFKRFGIQNTVLIDDLSLAHRPPPEKLFLRAVRALDGLPQKK
jgi:predicted esterase